MRSYDSPCLCPSVFSDGRVNGIRRERHVRVLECGRDVGSDKRPDGRAVSTERRQAEVPISRVCLRGGAGGRPIWVAISASPCPTPSDDQSRIGFQSHGDFKSRRYRIDAIDSGNRHSPWRRESLRHE